MKRTPEDVHDMHRMADAGRTYRSLADVRSVQAQIAEWIVEAAYARWGRVIEGMSEGEILAKCWENAQTQWPGIESLVEAINTAEREMWRNEKVRA